MAAHGHRSEHRRAAKDRHGIFDRRMALDPRRRRAAEGDALVERYVIADLGGFADHHAHAMVDEKAPADLSAGMNLDAGEKAADVADEARQGRETPAARANAPVDAIRWRESQDKRARSPTPTAAPDRAGR